MKKMVTQHSSGKISLMLKGALTVFFSLLLLLPLRSEAFSNFTVVQGKKVTINLSNVPLKQALSSLQKVSSYRFLYNTQLVDEMQKVTISASNEDITSVLDKMFAATNISYKVVDEQIILSPKESVSEKNSAIKEAVKSSSSKNGDEKTRRQIKGKVLDEEGRPIPGATVMVKGSFIGTATTIDGFFTIAVPEGKKSLIASFIGYIPVELALTSSDTYQLTLKQDFKRIDDVVVTGYQTISKERATGSYNIVKAEQLDKPTSNFAQRLIGTTSGVQAKTDADGNITFEIRGQSSLNNATAQPLVVVDGFAIDGNLSSVNPSDVESVTILKDAAAASIWGARSANGVIVVTLKSGASKKGTTNVTFSSFVKISPKIDLEYLYPHASSADVVDFEMKAFASNKNPTADGKNFKNSYSSAFIALNENRLGYLTKEELDATLEKLRNTDNRKQIEDNLLQIPLTQQYNLSVASSTDRTNNLVSLMYEGNKLNYKGNDNDRFIVNYKTTVNLFKWLDFSFLGTYGQTDATNNGGLYSGAPFENLVNADGSLVDVPNTYYMPNVKRKVPYTTFPYADWGYNPIEEVSSRDYSTRNINTRAQAGLTFKPLKGVTFDSKIQYEQITSEAKNILRESSFAVRSTVNEAASWDGLLPGVIKPNLPTGAFLDQNRSNTSVYNWRNQLNFNRSFLDRHQVSVIAGTEISSRVAQTVESPRTYGYNDEKLTVGGFPNGPGGLGTLLVKNWLGSSITFPYTHRYGYSTERYFSTYANGSYTLDRKYTLSGSVRADASNLITDDPKFRYSPFWSVGGSWIVSRESFMSKYSWLNMLTLRATYGFNGNIDRSTSFLPLINVGTTQDMNILDYAASIQSYGNPNLCWEKTGNLDLGVNFDMFNGKLYGKVDIYNKESKDLFVTVTIPSTLGTDSQKLNDGKMSNRGIELELGTNLRITKDISWSGNLNFSYNRNQIDKLNKKDYSSTGMVGGGTLGYVQGYNANTIWAYKYAGVVNKGTEANPDWQPTIQGPEGALYDFNSIAPGDAREYLLNMGTKVAPYSVGFTNSFKVYDFDLSFIVTGKFGHVFNGMTFNYPGFSSATVPNKLYQEVAVSDPNERVPIPFNKDIPFLMNFYTSFMDYRAQPADHLRFQELSLAYNVPKSVLGKVGFKAARVYAQANNLFIVQFNKYNEDPEFPMGNLRSRQSFIFGLNVSF